MRITNAQYRNAPITGIFELLKPNRNDPVEVLPSGKKQVQVICAWYGGRPNKKSGARIDVSSSASRVEVLNDFSGEVADNIGRSTNPSPLVEGAAISVMVTAYERNPLAREKCLKHYGTSCLACGFSFGETYGQSVTGCIHVHHLEPVAARGGKYVVDPIEDLRPVCPNCHAVLHLKKPPLSIEELKTMLGNT